MEKSKKAEVFQRFLCNLSSKNKGKPACFQHFHQISVKSIGFAKTKKTAGFRLNVFNNILQKHVLYGFRALWMQKLRKPIGFSICSAKYCKTRMFYHVFWNMSSKNKGLPTVFQYFQQHIAKNTGF